jgi:hypothetical protein
LLPLRGKAKLPTLKQLGAPSLPPVLPKVPPVARGQAQREQKGTTAELTTLHKLSLASLNSSGEQSHEDLVAIE